MIQEDAALEDQWDNCDIRRALDALSSATSAREGRRLAEDILREGDTAKCLRFAKEALRSPETRRTTLGRLAPQLLSSLRGVGNQLPFDARLYLASKAPPTKSCSFVTPAEIFRGLDSAKTELRVAALFNAIRHDDILYEAARLATCLDANAFARGVLASVVRKRLSLKHEASFTSRLLGLALEALESTKLPALHLKAAELLKEVSKTETEWPKHAPHVLLKTMLTSSWDQVRETCFQSLLKQAAVPVDISRLPLMISGPQWYQRDAAAKLLTLCSAALPFSGADLNGWLQLFLQASSPSIGLSTLIQYCLQNDNVWSQPSAATLLLLFDELTRSFKIPQPAHSVSYRALKATRDVWTTDSFLSHEDELEDKPQWHLTRAACIYLEHHPVPESGIVLIDEILLCVHDTGAIRAAESALRAVVKVATQKDIQDWMYHCLATLTFSNARPRSLGLAAALVALGRRNEIVSILLDHCDSPHSSDASTTICLHCLAEIVARSSMQSELYTRVFVLALYKADEKHWQVRSAASLVLARLSSRFTEDSISDTNFKGAVESALASLPTTSILSLAVTLRMIARLGASSELFPKVVLLLRHNSHTVRCVAAKAIARIASPQQVVHLLQNVTTSNEMHGAYMACRLMVSRIELSAPFILTALEKAFEARNWFAVIEMYEVCRALCPEDEHFHQFEHQAMAFEPRAQVCEPGESLALCRLCAGAGVRARPDRIRAFLFAANDELSVAVIERLLLCIGEPSQPELFDDFAEVSIGYTCVQKKVGTLVCHEQLPSLALDAVAYCCTAKTCGPTRRSLALRLALRVLPPQENEDFGFLILEKRQHWTQPTKAAGLQLAAILLKPSSLIQPIVSDAQSADLIVRRGACRALAIAPKTLLCSDRLLDIAMTLCQSDNDRSIQTLAARALFRAGCCPDIIDERSLSHLPEVQDELAPHAVWRRAKAWRQSKSNNTKSSVSVE